MKQTELLGDDPLELWMPVIGYEGDYEVSDGGNLASLKHGGRRLLSTNSRIEVYPSVGLSLNGKPTTFLIHRLVALSFVENLEGKPDINHIDGNPENNRAENLEWCTPAENSAHAVRIGLIDTKGEKCCASKLTEKDVLKIRKMSATIGQQQIAKSMNIAQSNVNKILQRQSWKHI